METAVGEAEALTLKSHEADPVRRGRPLKTAGDDERKSLPSHLPHIEVVIEPENKTCTCCGKAMHVIGEDESKRLDVVPAQYRVIVTRRPKYGCRSCEEAPVQAPAPTHLVPAHLVSGGLPTEALVAHILVGKYADHLPLYRQSQILARSGISIDRATLCRWVGFAACELKPLVDHMRAELLRSARLFVDETIAPVLDPGRGSVKKGYLWTIARNDSGHGGADPSAVVYTYAPGRGGQHARQLLEPFHGIIQCDGYGAYKQFADPKRARSIGPPNTLAFCWAHCRRKFYEIAKAGNAPIADEALIRIAALYAIEKSIRGQSCDIRRAARQERSKPLVKSLRLWLIGQAAKTVRASKLAEAITYVLNHWKGLTQFLHDGRIEMDNNAAERMIRPITLNRKNALFAGNDLGGENWAAVASIIETCKLCHINPQAYLTDILIKLASRWPNSRIDEIMPYNWKTEAVPATSDALAA